MEVLKTIDHWWIRHKIVNENIFDFSDNGWVDVIPQDGYFYADPFVVKENGLFYVFIECLTTSNFIGKIAYYTLDENLNNSDINFIDIPIDGHCSYPHIFKYNEQYYMIPETCGMNKINLYKCTKFPDKWEFSKTLVSNIHAADTTILFADKKVYLFTFVHQNNIDYFFIYHSDKLFGNYTLHNKVNAIVRKNNNRVVIRGAGSIINIEGKLYRPAQYSKKGIYGERIIIYEIQQISKNNYKEIPIILIDSDNMPSIRCTHTISLCENLITIDAMAKKQSDWDFISVNKNDELNHISEINNYENII